MTAPPSPLEPSPQEKAQRLADEVFFPAALATDAADRVPRRHLDRLAEAGLYHLSDPTTDLAVIEALAGGCLATTFVWIQHHSAMRAVAASPTPGLRERWLAPMGGGKCRAGIAVAGIRPGAAAVTARAVDGGWRVNGVVPWVTGWGLIDVLHTAARGPDGEVVWLLLDAVESPTLAWARVPLVAVNASVTGTVHFQDHFVPRDRLTGIESYEEWLGADARGGRTNGSLALGVTGRCCRLLGPGPLDCELVACRTALDAAARSDPSALPAARAGAAHLALRAAGDLVVATGSRSVRLDQHPQRLAREATFLLVFATRPLIQKELRRLFEGPG
jgi:alkylation response protein AidB-like acyl-CoA dehydrogenase